jgi:hypothetical protein
MKKRKIRLNRNIIIEKIEKESFLYNPEKDEVFSLNDIGLLVVESLKRKSMEIPDIIKKISDSFSEEKKEIIESDIKDFISILEKNNLIRNTE